MGVLRGLVAGIAVILACHSSAYAQFGAQLTGVGAINRSMGGAATAAPLDTLGAIQWNPATISALPNSTDFGLELLVPRSKLSSSLQTSPGGPTIQGSSYSTTNAIPLPEFGLVYRPEESPLSIGLGVLAVSGFGVNFPASTTNPILTPQPPNGIGLGSLYSQYALLQVVPTVAYQATEQLSIGLSPIVDMATLSLDPGLLAAPGAAGSYPPMTHGTYQWGAGFQLGAFYVTDSHWKFGASFKSTQWFNSFQYNSQDVNGAPRDIKVLIDAPMIISLGTSYTGFDRWLLALDLRYLDYRNTQPAGRSGYAPSGALNGVGWDNIFALSTGAQYQMTDAVSVRMGYSFSTNPISNSNTLFNVASPLVIQHGIYFGGSYRLTERLKLSMAYAHFFENSVSGPFISPTGPVPGYNVATSASGDSFIAGVSVTF
jgi:long-chain fatty acid transport protein